MLDDSDVGRTFHQRALVGLSQQSHYIIDAEGLESMAIGRENHSLYNPIKHMIDWKKRQAFICPNFDLRNYGNI